VSEGWWRGYARGGKRGRGVHGVGLEGTSTSIGESFGRRVGKRIPEWGVAHESSRPRDAEGVSRPDAVSFLVPLLPLSFSLSLSLSLSFSLYLFEICDF